MAIRIKHTRQELRAIHMLRNAWGFVDNPEAQDILAAAEMTLLFEYPSERERRFRDNLSVLRSIRKKHEPSPSAGSPEVWESLGM